MVESTRQDFLSLFRQLMVRLSLIGDDGANRQSEPPPIPSFALDPNPRILEIRKKIEEQEDLYHKAFEAKNHEAAQLILDKIRRLSGDLPALPRPVRQYEPCYLISEVAGQLMLDPQNNIFFMTDGGAEIQEQLKRLLRDTNLYMDEFVTTHDPELYAGILFDRFVGVGNQIGLLPYKDCIVKGLKLKLSADAIQAEDGYVIPLSLTGDIATLNIRRHRLSAPEILGQSKAIEPVPLLNSTGRSAPLALFDGAAIDNASLKKRGPGPTPKDAIQKRNGIIVKTVKDRKVNDQVVTEVAEALEVVVELKEDEWLVSTCRQFQIKSPSWTKLLELPTRRAKLKKFIANRVADARAAQKAKQQDSDLPSPPANSKLTGS